MNASSCNPDRSAWLTCWRWLVLGLPLVAGSMAGAQGFSSGSTGVLGALNVTSNTVVTLPEDGILHYTTVFVGRGFTLSFRPNEHNTPVVILAQGDIVVEGIIDVSGKSGSSLLGGVPGPGGYEGGKPGHSGQPPGAGQGPGGGRGGEGNAGPNGAGGGAYGTVAAAGNPARQGRPYGSPLVMPLVGGSGGGGVPSTGGGGGGGALLLASSTRIHLENSARIDANGGSSGWGYGSGGSLRLVAPVISGNGSLTARGSSYGGEGRIRLDTINRRLLQLSSIPVYSLGAFMTVFPPTTPRLDIVEAGGTVIPEGSASPVTLQLPFGSDPNQTVTVQARDFGREVEIEVALIPDSGEPLVYTAMVPNGTANPATVMVPVQVPANVLITVQAWAR